MDAGECYRRPGYKAHLWIVISDPSKDRKCVVSVNLSSVKENTKASQLKCILDVGDHSFVRGPSRVMFKYASVKSDSELERMVGGGGYNIDGNVSADVLQKIRQGAIESEDTPMGVVDILTAQGLA